MSTTALTPSLLLAALYDRAQLPPLDRSFLGDGASSRSRAGSLGAALLLLTPERMFAALVPLLLGFATVLFAYAGPHQRLAARARRAPAAEAARAIRSPRCCRSASMAAISAPASAC